MQYRANDDGRSQRPFVVRSAATAPWLLAGTGLGDGSTFGQELGGYGIEIDQTTPFTPPGTIVLAEIPDLFGPGLTAQMTYYETPQGAKVFAGGAIDFGGTARRPGRCGGCSRTCGRACAVRRGDATSRASATSRRCAGSTPSTCTISPRSPSTTRSTRRRDGSRPTSRTG